MKLKARTALVPIITVTLLSLGLLFLVNQLTVASFNRLENQILHDQVERVHNSLNNLVEDHALKIVDWSQWDMTYDFMETLSPSYIDENLNSLTLGALGFSSVMYFTPNLDLKYGVTVVDEENVVAADPALVNQVKAILSQSRSPAFQGLVRLGGNDFMFAASPILPNNGDLASRGLLVATAKVDQSMFDLVQHLTNLSLKFTRSDSDSVDAQFKLAISQFHDGVPYVVSPQSSDLTYAFGQVKDWSGLPLMTFRVEDSRQIVSSGLKVRDYFIGLLLGSGLLATLLLVALINFSATKRIQQFSEQVRLIAKSSDSSKRLNDYRSGHRSLRVTSALGVLFVFVTLAVGSSVLFNRYFLSGFNEVEDKVMQDNLERSSRALKGRLEKLMGKVTDWAQWDDSYAFIEDHNQEYSTANLGIETLGRMGLKYALYFNTERVLIDGRVIDNEKQSISSPSEDIVKAFSDAQAVSQAMAPVAGFLSMPGMPVLAAASPILDTARSQPSKGSMIFSTLADATLADELGHQTRLNLQFLSPGPDSKNSLTSISRINDEKIQGRATILDFSKKPVLDIAVNAGRPIYAQGLLAAKVLPIYFLVGGFLCALITVVWVDRILVSRIRLMGNEVAAVRTTGDAGIRVTTGGSDEVSGLANDINSMLSALQKTQEELKMARNAADSANAAKSMFIARVSHELRTPIGGITGINRIIKKQNVSRAVCELVEMSNQAAWNLVNIIDEILDFSKAESGELTLEKIPFEIRQLVRETMQIIAGRLSSKEKQHEKSKLELACEVDAKVPTMLRGDPTRLKQILINLLGNALKFSHSGYVGLRIVLNSKNQNIANLKIEVWDTGIGIAQDKLNKIFEPFKQAEDSTSRQYQGTGLGLAIVKQFTEAFGGSVSVQSRSGQGTTFTVEIPLEIDTTYVADKPPIGFRPKVALVANAGRITSSLSTHLMTSGAEVQELDPNMASNAHHSKELIASDLLVVAEDALNLPWMLQVVQTKVKSKPSSVVAMVRPSNLALRETLYGLGVEFALPTPVLADDLLAAALGNLKPQSADSSEEDGSGLKLDRALRILIADDMPTNRIILEDMLGEAGHQVVSVDDGKKMLDRLTPMITGAPAAEKFDIVFTDISMPIMDGYAATRAIRALEVEHGAQMRVPILAITAHAFGTEQQRMKEAGVDGIVTKPIRPLAVANEFSRVLASKAQLVRELEKNVSPTTTVVETELDINQYLRGIVEQFTAEYTDHLDNGHEDPSLLLDVADVYKRSRSSWKTARAVLRAFNESYSTPLTKLEQARAAKDLVGIEKSSHALKGLLLDIGSKSSAEVASSIEHFCKAKNVTEAADLVPLFISQVALVARVAAKLVETLPTLEMKSGTQIQRPLDKARMQR